MDTNTTLEIIQSFFTAPLWTDTIKDFIIANCYIFIGEEEFSIEHLNCHKNFCNIIEKTLSILLIDFLNISFEQFENICFEASKYPNSIALNVLSVLKQVTDFKYFSSKMYAYNVMLDQQVNFQWKLHGNNENNFFNENENNTVDNIVKLATSELNKVEEELDLPPSVPILDIKQEIIPEKLNPIIENIETKKIEPEIILPPKMTEEERNTLKIKILRERENQNKNIDPEEIKRRKEIFLQRKQKLINEKHNQYQENIKKDIEKHKIQIPINNNNNNEDALLKALASRVKTLIDKQ